MTIKPNRIERYYDSHEVEGEDLTQSFVHYVALQYLILVIEWLFNGKAVGIVSNVNFYQTDHTNEKPKSPDIAVVEGLVLEECISKPSYYVGEDGPPPLVVFEVASKESWQIDLETKPGSYAGMSIREYFAFDPNEPSVWTGTWREESRLVGWQLDTASGEYRQFEKDATGRIWSEQLQSWLKVEGQYLRLYTPDGQLRLTGIEAQTQRAALERARAEAQTQRATLESVRAEAQIQRAALESARVQAAEQHAAPERARVEAAEQQAALERAKVEKLLDLLRQNGINPDDLI
jgi:Uma2 family endonuclease